MQFKHQPGESGLVHETDIAFLLRFLFLLL